MGTVIGIVLFVIGLLVSIGLHEIGHLVPAKRFGVKVSEYFIGFGPKLWSRRKGDTEYGLKAIPFGGYVRMVGMINPGQWTQSMAKAAIGDASATQVETLPKMPTTRVGRLVEESRLTSALDIDPGDEDRVFYKLSTPKKLIVMIGGPVMNLFIALVLFAIVYSVIGVPGVSTTVDSVAQCISTSEDGSCAATDPAAPAAVAGLEPGDRIVAVEGQETTEPDEIISAVSTRARQPTTVTILRNGETKDISVVPVAIESGSETVGRIGVAFARELKRDSLAAVPALLWTNVSETLKLIPKLPQGVFNAGSSVVTGEARDQNSVIGVVGVARFSGEALSTDNAGVDIWNRVVFFLLLLASLNVALFVFNLIPLVPLDGGHAAGALWEGAKRTVARVRKKPLPGPADMARMMPVAYAGFALIAVMGAVLILADLLNPITLG